MGFLKQVTAGKFLQSDLCHDRQEYMNPTHIATHIATPSFGLSART